MPQDLKFFLSFAKPYRAMLLLAGLLAAGQSMVTLIIPWMGGGLVSSVIHSNASFEPRYLLEGLLAVIVCQALLRGASQYYLGRTSEKMLGDMRVRIFDHLQVMPLSFHQRQARGDVLAYLATDASVVSHFLIDYAVGLIPQILTAIGAGLIMLNLAPKLGLLALLLLPLYFVSIRWLGRQLRPLAVAIRQKEGELLSIAEENLGLQPVIKAFTRELMESTRYRTNIKHLHRLLTRQRRIQILLGPVIELTAGVSILMFVGYGLLLVDEKRLNEGELVSMLLYVRLLVNPLTLVSGFYGHLQRARGAMARLLRMLQEPVETLSTQAKPLKRARGAIRFEGVTFAYPGRPPVLKNIDLVLAPKEIVAVTGPNGAGKSTLGHLLLRFYDPDRGRVLLDDVDVRKFSLHDLRRQIGVVSQHVLLCNGSISENIRLGRHNATDDEIYAAARLAHAEKFITQLPDQYQTQIGEDGVRLSGGQRQRIAMARALLKDPPILILDEATSMLDPSGEDAFVNHVAPAFAGRTVLIITHRPATLRLADRHIHMENGRVMFCKNFEESPYLMPAHADLEDGITNR